MRRGRGAARARAARARRDWKLSGDRERACATVAAGRRGRAGLVGRDRGPDPGRVLGQQPVSRARRGADRDRRRGRRSAGRRSSSRSGAGALWREPPARRPPTASRCCRAAARRCCCWRSCSRSIPGFVGNSLTDIQRTHRALVYQAHLRDRPERDHQRLRRREASCSRCGTVMTEGFQVPMVAYALDVHTLSGRGAAGCGDPIRGTRPAPNTILQTRAQSNAIAAAPPQTILDWEHDGTPLPDLPRTCARSGCFQLARLR